MKAVKTVSLVKQYKKLLEMDGVTLDFEEAALKLMANKAIKLKTGARGLRSIMEETMMDVMFETPSDTTIEKCIVTEECVENGTSPRIIKVNPDSKIDKRILDDEESVS